MPERRITYPFGIVICHKDISTSPCDPAYETICLISTRTRGFAKNCTLTVQILKVGNPPAGKGILYSGCISESEGEQIELIDGQSD